MSQTETPSDHLRKQRKDLLLDLARQAEARKLQVKQMLAKCADERDRENERLRGIRRETLQKISTEVRELRDPAIKPVVGNVSPPSAAVSAAPTRSQLDPPQASSLAFRPKSPESVKPSPAVSIQVKDLDSKLAATSILAEKKISSEKLTTVSPLAGIPGSVSATDSQMLRLPTPVPAAAVIARPDVEVAFERRMSGLEDAFAKLVETVTERLDYSSRISQVEAQYAGLRGVIEEFSSKFHPLENKCDVLRGDLRSLELSEDRIGEQVKSFDQIFASLGRDSQKLNHVVEGLAVELRQVQDRVASAETIQQESGVGRNSEMVSLQERLTRLESGMVRAIGLLQSSEHGIADLSHLRERFLEMEAGFERVLKVIDSLDRPNESSDTAAEREATANVLASLTKLVQGMRVAQTERQIQHGVRS